MYKLCELHLSVENYTEAAFTLLRRADDLKVSNDLNDDMLLTRDLRNSFWITYLQEGGKWLTIHSTSISAVAHLRLKKKLV